MVTLAKWTILQILCLFCYKLPRGNSHGGNFGKLITKPFQHFKRAKGGVLVVHESYQYHKEAVLMGKSFLSQYNDPTLRIDNILDCQSQELTDSNRLALQSIVDCIIHC